MNKIQVAIVLLLLASGGSWLLLTAILRPYQYVEDRVVGLLTGSALLAIVVIQLCSNFGWGYFTS